MGTLANYARAGLTNARLSRSNVNGDNKMKLRATKNTRNNDEILINYGRGYHMHEQGVNTQQDM